MLVQNEHQIKAVSPIAAGLIPTSQLTEANHVAPEDHGEPTLNGCLIGHAVLPHRTIEHRR